MLAYLQRFTLCSLQGSKARAAIALEKPASRASADRKDLLEASFSIDYPVVNPMIDYRKEEPMPCSVKCFCNSIEAKTSERCSTVLKRYMKAIGEFTKCKMRILGVAPLIFPLGITAQSPTPMQDMSRQSVAASAIGHSQTVTQPQPDPTVIQFKKTVVLLETDCSTTDDAGTRKIAPYLGTGFLVSYQDSRFPKIGGFSYLVTNRHVALPGVEHSAPCRVIDYKIRLNLITPAANGSMSEVYSLGSALPWAFPQDPSVDLALMPFGPDPAKHLFGNNILDKSTLIR